MRLRFRGACWDATISEPFLIAPSTDAPRANTKSPDPLRFFAEFVGGSSLSMPRGPTLLPRNSITSVYYQSPAIRWRWDGQHEVPLRCRGSGVREDLERSSDLKEDNEEESEDSNRRGHSPTRTCDILASSPFCAVVSDPATAPLREPTFSEIMLTDGHGRELLFSVTQETLLKNLMDISLREGALLANSPSRGPRLHYLLESVCEATRELRLDPSRTDDDAEGCQSSGSSVTGIPLEQCFEPAATLNLDAEVPLYLLERLPEDDPLLHADIMGLATGLDAASSKRVVEESWSTLGIEHLLVPLQVPSVSFDVTKWAPSWVTEGSLSYIGQAGGSWWGGSVPVGTKTGAHNGARELLPVDEQENLTNTSNPVATSGDTFTRIDVGESARDPDLRLQASLEQSSLLDAVGNLKHQVQVDTPSEQLGEQMGSDLPIIDQHRSSLREKYPAIPLASPRRPKRNKGGYKEECRREKSQSLHVRGESSLEIDHDRYRVDEECTRSAMLWEALDVVKWSTTDKKAPDTPKGYLMPGRRCCLEPGALEVSRVPLGRQLGEDPKSTTDRLLDEILVSWRKIYILANTEEEQPSWVPDQVPTRKRSVLPQPEPPHRQRQLQPLLPSSRAVHGHSIRRAVPSPRSHSGKLCYRVGESATRESDGAPAIESTTKGEPSGPAANQFDSLHSKIAPSASRREEWSVSHGNSVHEGNADEEEIVVKHGSTGVTKLSQSAHQKEEDVVAMAGVGGDITDDPSKSKIAGMTSTLDTVESGFPSDVRNDTSKKGKMPCNAQDTSTPNKFTRGLGEAPSKRRCLEGVTSKRPAPIQRPLAASDASASKDPHNRGKVQSPRMSWQSKPFPVDLPRSFSSTSTLAVDKTSPDTLPSEQRQSMRFLQNDAARHDGKTSSTTRMTAVPAASHGTSFLATPPAQRTLSESISVPVARGNSVLSCRESSSKKQLPKRGRTSTKIVREDHCPTPQPGNSQTEGDPALDVCESERHRGILSMIRAGAVEEAFHLCGEQAASGSLTGSGSTSVAPSSKTLRRASASGFEDTSDFDTDGGMAKGNPLCAIVSGHFVEMACPTVLALSSDRTDAAASQRMLKSHDTLTRVYNLSTVKSRCTGVFSFLELPVEAPVDLVIGSRTGVVILDDRNPGNPTSLGRNAPDLARDTGAVPPEGPSVREAPLVVEAKEKFRLLTLQTLKYSRVWLIVQMDKVRADSQPGSPIARPCSVIDRLEQWLVGFPCQVFLRYSHGEVHLAELITHAALTERQKEVAAVGGAGSGSVAVREKRRRLETSLIVARSPLDEVEDHFRNDPEWAAVHHRQAWFLQLFPSLNAFSASVLLSAASLKHLLVSPYEELAPTLLRREGGKGARGGVDAESLRDFCDTIRFEGRGKLTRPG